MDLSHILLLGLLFFLAALLYSSVGHAGASAYIAAMVLMGVAPSIIKPTAFILNIFVASLVTYQFRKEGYFQWKLFWPFACASVPCAFLASYASLPLSWFKLGLVVILLLGALRLFLHNDDSKPWYPNRFSNYKGMMIGGMIGGLSGLTGTGGGIFLSPIILFSGWANTRTTSGISAAFILVNSIAGLLGCIASTHFIPEAIFLWVPIVAFAGFLGSQLGIRKLPPKILLRFLGLVMVIAACKLMF